VQAALAGADSVYMIPPAFHPDETAFAITALRSAECVGVRRYVYVSVLHPHTPTLRHHMRKAEAEAVIRNSPLTWTILQPSMYCQMVGSRFAKAPPGVVRVPFNVDSSKFSLIDLRDLSEVAVKTLTEDGHECATYELCGPQATITELASAIGHARGVALEPLRVAPADAPLPPGFGDGQSSGAEMRAMWEEYDQHGFRGNINILQMLLGRAPADFEDVARSLIPKTG
jgi:NAD(P)H dehydrogenase (quinone)